MKVFRKDWSCCALQYVMIIYSADFADETCKEGLRVCVLVDNHII